MVKSFVLSVFALGVLNGCASWKKKSKDKVNEGKQSEAPVLGDPEVRRVWVPEKIEGDQYIDGHYIYIINKPATWKKQ